MVRAEDSRPRGREFESCRILDGCKRFASYYNKEKLKMGETKKLKKESTPYIKYRVRWNVQFFKKRGGKK